MTVRVKLIVDSAADLPAEWLARWDIAVMPCFVNFGEESIPDDGVTLPRAEFYRRLASATGPVRTSAPSPGLAQEIIEKQLAKAEQVVVFTVASKLSSVYNSARIAADNVDPKRVTVVDTSQVAMGEGWIVAVAAEAAERGATVDEILAAAESTRQRVHLYAAIDTLEYLRRSGRVSNVIASIGTMLQIKPIVKVEDGEVTPAQRVRTMSKATQALCEILHNNTPLERLAVLHSNFIEGAQALREQVADIAPANTIISEITTTVGTHIGPGCVGFSFVKKSS